MGWNYLIWGTIGHPIVCLGPFAFYTVRATIDLFEDSTCTTSVVGVTSSQATIWEVGLSAYCVLALLIVIPAVIRVSVQLHKNVKFELEWKEQDEQMRGVAIENAVEGAG